jgi:hypothetical protein
MTQPTLDPAEFAARLDRAFGTEPGHADLGTDLARGRRRLRRHRLVTGTGALAVTAVAAAAVAAVPGVLPHPAARAQYAAGALTDAQVVQDCLESNDHVLAGGPGTAGMPRAEVLATMGDARLMTRADTGPVTVATVRSEDGRSWMDCTLSRREPALKAITVLYPTAVHFPRTTIGGTAAYEPHDEADPRLAGTATPDIPTVQVTCDIAEQEETPAYRRAEAACPTYRITWNDRRPAEVGHVFVTTPDGKELTADVRDGYLSLAWTGPMTPAVARAFARGETPRVRHIAFYDDPGELLVDDRQVGAIPAPDRVTVQNWPSLAWWARR